MMTRFYVRQIKYNTQIIGCYDVEHTTGRHDAYNALLKITNNEFTVVVEILDSIVLERECKSDKPYVNGEPQRGCQ